MGIWEPTIGATDEWYTPRWLFDALGCRFDLDVSDASNGRGHVPADAALASISLLDKWHGFVWMNPPFGGRNGLEPWLNRFFLHGNGIALTPDRTSARWWQDAAHAADAILLLKGKVKFERPDGSTGNSPSNGTTLFAAGKQAVSTLKRASKLGILLARVQT